MLRPLLLLLESSNLVGLQLFLHLGCHSSSRRHSSSHLHSFRCGCLGAFNVVWQFSPTRTGLATGRVKGVVAGAIRIALLNARGIVSRCFAPKEDAWQHMTAPDTEPTILQQGRVRFQGGSLREVKASTRRYHSKASIINRNHH